MSCWYHIDVEPLGGVELTYAIKQAELLACQHAATVTLRFHGSFWVVAPDIYQAVPPIWQWPRSSGAVQWFQLQRQLRGLSWR